jgi:SAM-dependent methyltransferase
MMYSKGNINRDEFERMKKDISEGGGDNRMPLGSQEDHWNKTYSGKSAFFGEGPSEFARKAANLFKRNTFKSESVRTILELGCGQGRDTLFFAQEGYSVTGLDYSKAGFLQVRQSAREFGVSDRITIQNFDVRKPLPFPDGSFDVCYSHMLLCMELSMTELIFLLGEIRRVLKPGGIVLYSVRNTFDKHFGTGIHKSEGMYEVGGFVVHFFNEEMVQDLAAGYEIVDIERMQEGSLPKELFGVFLRKQEMGVDDSVIRRG